MTHLSGRRVNLQLLRELGRKEFSACFADFNGTVCLGWCDDSLRDALNLIVEMSYLQELNVVKMFLAEQDAVVPNIAPNVVFITKPSLESVQLISEIILRTRDYERSSDHIKFHIMFVPRKCYLCEEKMRQMNVLDLLKDRIYECAIDFYPIDNDFFSMELPESFREYCIEEDNSSLFVAARGLNSLQNLLGTIPRIYGKGKAAELVFQYMARMRGEVSSGSSCLNEVSPLFDNLLLIDRSVDLLSILPTQLTYEDNDFFSMELPESFREYCIEEDNSSLFVAARGLNSLQNLLGTIPRIYGKGKAAELVFQYMARMRGEVSSGSSCLNEVSPLFDNLLLIDRSVDLLSILPTQLTYEGLLDETVRIRSTAAKFPSCIFKSEENNKQQSQQPLSDAQETKKVFLSSADPMFTEESNIQRDKDYRLVGPHLVKKLDVIRETYQKHKQKDTSMAELKLFTSNLPHLIAEKENVSKHTAIATLLKDKSQTMDFKEHIIQEQNLLFMDSSLIGGSSGPVDLDKVNPYVETCMSKLEPITKVLRLICMQSVLNNGLKQKVLDQYKRDIIQTYGYQYLTTILNLEKAGLLSSPGARTMPSIKKTLKLIDSEFDFRNATDVCSVFDGYAPISVRLGQFIRAPGWRSIEEILKVLPGPKIDERQEVASALRKKSEDPSVVSTFVNPDSPQLTLVFFIGGVTYAEVSAFRSLSSNDENGAEFIVGSTSVINGSSFIEALMDDYSHAFDTSDLTSYNTASARSSNKRSSLTPGTSRRR